MPSEQFPQALAILTRNMSEPAILFDVEGRVLVMNAPAETLFETRLENVRGSRFDRIIPCPREYAGNVVRYLQDYLLANPNPWSHPVVAIAGTSSRLGLMVHTTEMQENGEPCTLVLFNDVSDSVADFRDLRKRLAATESLSAAKTQFLEHLNREMRTPVSMMLGVMGHLLDRDDVPVELRQDVSMAYQAAREMQGALSEIGDFTQLENDHLQFENICFNTRYVLEELLESFNDQARKRNLEFATLIAPSVPEFLIGDPNRLRQVLQTFLNNAFRHTVEGGITIKAQCLVESATSATVEFEISDTGLGISEARRKDMQAAFENQRSDFANRFVGLGIGLAIAKELVDRMGGRLTVRSTEKVGSSFLVTLRFEKGEQMRHEQRILTGKRVLVVNDALEDRNWLIDVCKSERMKVDWVGSAGNAIKYLTQDAASLVPVEFVVIDLHELKMAGVYLAQEIRTQSVFRNVSILMLSSGDEGITPSIANSCGINVLLNKPVRRGVLIEAFRAALAQQRQLQPMLVTHHLLSANGHSRSRRALLVEDNEVNQIIAKGALRRLGITADVTNNGEEAIDAVRENRYDFILMDCEMPVMDGFEATRLIREWEQAQGERTPIIALTASDTQDCREQCLAAGMDEYMQKPFRADQLQNILDRIA